MLNDITTNITQPPDFKSIKSKYPERNLSFDVNTVSEHQETYGSLKGLSTGTDAAEAYSKVSEYIANHRGWKLQGADSKAHLLEYTATTLVMRYKDDIVIHVRESGKNSVVEMRSKSRVGKSDLGANAKRIKKLFSELEPLFK